MRALVVPFAAFALLACPAAPPSVDDLDGGGEEDAGEPLDDAGPRPDAGDPDEDAGDPDPDGGTPPPQDAGDPDEDAGEPDEDGGTPPPADAGYDAGPPPPPVDGGPVDPPVRDSQWTHTQGGPLTAFTTSFNIQDSLPDDLILVFVVTSPYSPTLFNTGVSGLAAQTTTMLEQQRSGKDQTGIDLWSIFRPQGNGAISVFLSYETDTASLIAIRYRNVHTAPVGAHISANTNGPNGGFPLGTDSASYSVPVPGVDRGTVLVTGVATHGATHGFGVNFAEIFEVAAGDASSAAQEGIVLNPPVSTSGSFSMATDWAIAAVEVVGPQS